MDNVGKYIEYQNVWSKAACEGNYDEYKKLVAKGLKFRNENFTKEDWEKLIAQSTGRAKYEYTRMMKEKFPD
jgi:hypothetical protein